MVGYYKTVNLSTSLMSCWLLCQPVVVSTYCLCFTVFFSWPC